MLNAVALVACPSPLCIEKDCKCSEGIGVDGGESTGIISCAKSSMSSTVNCHVSYKGPLLIGVATWVSGNESQTGASVSWSSTCKME